MFYFSRSIESATVAVLFVLLPHTDGHLQIFLHLLKFLKDNKRATSL